MDRNAPRLRYSENKTKQITIRITDDEFNRVNRVCNKIGRSKQELVYGLIMSFVLLREKEEEANKTE